MSVLTGRSESTINVVWRLLMRVTIIALVLLACYYLRNIIATLCIGAIIAYVLDPAVEWITRRPGFIAFHSALANSLAGLMQAYKRVILRQSAPTPMARKRMSRYMLRSFATIYVFILAVFALWKGVALIVTPFVAEFRAATSVEGRQQALKHKEEFVRWYNEHAPEWAQSGKVQQIILKSDFSKSASAFATQIGERVLDSLKNIVEVVLLPVLAFYFIIDGRKLKRELVGLLPRSRLRETLRMLNEFNRIMRAFVAGQFLLCLLAGLIVGVGLALLHVKFPVILGVMAGITRAIPIIGPIIGGIPIILLTLATKGFGTALAVLGFFTLMHFAESKFIMPMLIGDRMELHPVIIIIVLLVGGELGGLLIGGSLGALLGMFFAAPIASLIRVALRRYWLRAPMKPTRQKPLSPAALAPQTTPASLPEVVD